MWAFIGARPPLILCASLLDAREQCKRTPDKQAGKVFNLPTISRLALGVDEFAQAVGVGRTIIFAEIKAGRLLARKLGKRTLIYDQDGRAWLELLPFAGEVA